MRFLFTSLILVFLCSVSYGQAPASCLSPPVTTPPTPPSCAIDARSARIIEDYLVRRSDVLFSQMAGLTDRLRFRELGVDGRPSEYGGWGRLGYGYHEDDHEEGNLLSFHGGVDYLLDGAVLGIGGVYDSADESSRYPSLTGGDYSIDGNGWLLGPYYVGSFGERTYYESRLLVGLTENDISLDGNVAHPFETFRMYYDAKLSGIYRSNDWDVIPSLGFVYYNDRRRSFSGHGGDVIGSQSHNSSRLTLGTRFTQVISGSGTTKMIPEFGALGILVLESDSDGGDVARSGVSGIPESGSSGADDIFVRFDAGVSFDSDNGVIFRFDGYYDALGRSSFESWGGSAGLTARF